MQVSHGCWHFFGVCLVIIIVLVVDEFSDCARGCFDGG